MRITALGIYLLASMVVVSAALLAFAPQLPEKYTHVVADSAIFLALAAYGFCWIAVGLAVFSRQTVVAAWRSGNKPAFAVSVLLIIGFLYWVSSQLLAVFRSTDL